MQASSGKYLVWANLVSKVFVFIGSILLARILFPEDYGYLLIAALFDGFFNLFSISGFETYYIQQRDLSDAEDEDLLAACFWLRLRQSVILFFVQLLLGVGLWLFRDPILGQMIGILSFQHLLNIIGRPNEAYLSKNLRFRPIAISNFIRDVLSPGLKMVFALTGFGPLSFVLGQVIAIVPRELYLRRSIGVRPRILRKHEEFKNIMPFARAVFLNTSGAYLTSQADAAIVSAFYPKALVGFYNFSKKQAGLPYNLFLGPLNPLILSYISKFKFEQKKLLLKFDSVGFLLMLIVLPIFIYGLVDIESLIAFVFGEKWLESAGLVRVFLLYFCYQFISYPSGFLPTSLGKPGIKARISYICFAFLIVALLMLARAGAELIYYAWTYVLIYFIKDFWVGLVGFRILGQSTYSGFIMTRIRYIHFLIIALLISLLLLQTDFNVAVRVLIFLSVQYTITLTMVKFFHSEKMRSSLVEIGAGSFTRKLKFIL